MHGDVFFLYISAMTNYVVNRNKCQDLRFSQWCC